MFARHTTDPHTSESLFSSANVARSGENGTITAVVNALAKAGVELGENGSVIPRPKGKR
jgi:hypothetical protein